MKFPFTAFHNTPSKQTISYTIGTIEPSGVPMSFTLDTKAFFFNAKTDYLPYYKPFHITIEENATVKDLLFAIQEQNENFTFPKQKLAFRINGWVVEAKQPLKTVVERLGNELQIDPVFSYRSVDDLKINDADFMQSYSLLEPYANEEYLKYYKGLYALHYASETLNYCKEYIGDAVLLLAYKMIHEGSPHKDEILKAITEVDCGLFECEYDNNLFEVQDHTDEIEELKAMARGDLDDDDDAPTLLEMIKSRLGIEPKIPAKKKDEQKHDNITIADIDLKFVAYYYGDHEKNSKVESLISQKAAALVDFEKARKRCGLYVIQDDPKLAYKKAGTIMLDAFDNMAEVMVIEDPHAYEMMSQNFKKIEESVGREIGLELTTSAALLKQFGNTSA